MKGLIKGAEEIPETAWSGFIRTHLELMHTQEPQGNGYALAEEYIEGYEWIITVRGGMLYASRGNPKPEDAVTETKTVTEEIYTVNGKTYTKSELEKLINQ